MSDVRAARMGVIRMQRVLVLGTCVFLLAPLCGCAQQAATPSNPAPNAPAAGEVRVRTLDANGQLTGDVDGDTLTVVGVMSGTGTPTGGVAGAITGTYGVLTLNADGSYSYNPTTARAEALGVDEFGRDVFSYRISDGHGGYSTATLTINVTGSNDAPTAAPDTNCTTEDGHATGDVIQGLSSDPNCVRGMDTDIDGDTPLVVSGVAVGSGAPNSGNVGVPLTATYGVLTLNADGTYSFDATTAAAQRLGVGDVVQQVFTYQITDGNGGYSTTTLTICVTGANDGPVARLDTGVATEDVTLSVTAANGVLKNDSDVDGDTLTVVGVMSGSGTPMGAVASAVTGTYGVLTLNADGSYSYSPTTASAEALGVGKSGSDVFSYQISDGHGGFSTATLTLTVTGTNDAPVARPDVGSATEDVTLSVSAANGVLKNDSDTDTGDVLTVVGVMSGSGTPTGSVASAVTGTYGVLTLNADGSYSYKPTTTKAQELGVGESGSDVFSYRISDGHGGYSTTTLTLTVKGTNDCPVACCDTGVATEDVTLSVTAANGVLKNDSDVDGDSLTVVGVMSGWGTPTGSVNADITGTYGVLHLNADGSYTYLANTQAAENLCAGQTANDIFSYRISDGHGGYSTAALNLTVIGQADNHAPVANADVIMASPNDNYGTYDAAHGLLQNSSHSSTDYAWGYSYEDSHKFQKDTDADGDALTIVGIAIGDVGHAVTGGLGQWLSTSYVSIKVNADGSFAYNVNTRADGMVDTTFTYTISDGHGGTSTTTLKFTVNDPLVLDLDGDGIETTSAGVGFDMNADGNKDTISWVGKDDGLLVRDANGDGTINDGSELFGNSATRTDGTKGYDGFSVLSDLDSNHDGVIDAKDAEFSTLKVWQDANQDGVSQADELKTLDQLGIASISLGYTGVGQVDANGNNIALQSTYTTTDGKTNAIADVWFGGETDTVHLNLSDPNEATQQGDVVTWHLTDDSHNIVVEGFDASDDKLDLRDLLVDTHADSIASALHVTKEGSSTVLQITDGSGDSAKQYNVTLEGVDLLANSTEQQVIQELLNKNRIVTD
jgi:VCBS repeat-containing protein